MRKILIILALLLIVPLAYLIAFKKSQNTITESFFLPQTELKLYVPFDSDHLMVKKVKVESPKNSQYLASFLIKKLKEFGAIGDKVELLHFAKDRNGTIYLDFSRDFLEEDDELSEVAKVYSVVNTFISNFPNSNRVQLLVDGEPFFSLGGVLFTYFPLEFNEDLVEEK